MAKDHKVDDKRLCLADDLKESSKITYKTKLKGTSSSLNPKITTTYHMLKIEVNQDYEHKNKDMHNMLEYLEEDKFSELLEELPEEASSPSWSARHGSVLTISSMLRHIPTIMSASPLFAAVSFCLKNSLKDKKFPVRETSIKALGRLLLHQIQKDPSNTNAHKGTVVSIAFAMQDDSSKVRSRALYALKAVSKLLFL
ncbi:protein ILITYHIA [Tanacetum coccineum]